MSRLLCLVPGQPAVWLAGWLVARLAVWPWRLRQGLPLMVALTLLLASAGPRAAPSGDAPSDAPPASPYTVTVWARVLFGTDGLADDVAIVDEASYPPAFTEQVLARLAKARIPAPRLGDAPATLRTGVELQFQITPAAGEHNATVKFLGLGMAPLPVQRYLANAPDEIAASGGWSGGVTATCQVAVDGHCAEIQVRGLPGMPESLRRFARASFERWRFEPQQLNGQAIPGTYSMHFALETLDSLPEDFRADKFGRAQRGR